MFPVLCSGEEAGSTVLYHLKTVNVGLRYACKQAVVNVQSRCDNCSDDLGSCFIVKMATDPGNPSNVVIHTSDCRVDMGTQTHDGIKYGSEVSNRSRWNNALFANSYPWLRL